MRKKPKLYFAAPLFSDMERQYNKDVAERLTRYFDVFLPQEDGGLMVDLISEGASPSEAANKVFRIDIDALDNCELFLIILDGRTIDEGAAVELGYAFAKGKKCVGLQTDVRRLLPVGNNPMIGCAVTEIFQEIGELLTWAEQFTLASITSATR